jgi:hypothetical protein
MASIKMAVAKKLKATNTSETSVNFTILKNAITQNKATSILAAVTT